MKLFGTTNRVMALFFGLWVSFTFGLLAVSCSDEPPPAATATVADPSAATVVALDAPDWAGPACF